MNKGENDEPREKTSFGLTKNHRRSEPLQPNKFLPEEANLLLAFFI